MPLVSIEKLSEKVSLGLWNMAETLTELYQQYPFLNSYKEMLDKRYRSEPRKKEFLCTHILLSKMLNSERYAVDHFPSGKPFIKGGPQISISHTKGYVAVILGTSQKVAVDIEYRSDRVQRIAHKFIRKDEISTSILSQLLHWSAKETLYKYYSETPLEYFEMRMRPFEVMQKGIIEGENMKSNIVNQIYYLVTDDYVLTYSF